MKYKTILRNGAILLAASVLTLSACKRESNSGNGTPANGDDNGGYASDAAKMENNSNDVVSIADAANTGSTVNLRTTATTATTIGTCAHITSDSTVSGGVTTRVLTIDFGTTDCVCVDSKSRRGAIVVTYTGAYKDSGSVRTITYSNYYVNDNHISGSKTVTNKGKNTSGQVYYTVNVNDSLTTTTDSVITWTGSRIRTWSAGYLTPERTDDVYLISDAGSTGTTLRRANGHTFTFSITTPLQVALDCPYVEAGILTITGSSITGSRILNFGTGDCDNRADLTIGGTTYHILLH